MHRTILAISTLPLRFVLVFGADVTAVARHRTSQQLSVGYV